MRTAEYKPLLRPRTSTVLMMVLGAAFVAASCSETGGSSCGVTSEQACKKCDSDNVHMCHLTGVTRFICSDELDAQVACEAEYGDDVLGANSEFCGSDTGLPDPTGDGESLDTTEGDPCSEWDPQGNIDFDTSSNEYVVQGPWLDKLIADPRPLMDCDDAELNFHQDQSVVGLEVSKANAGEALYELGLRNKEVITGINGMPVSSIAQLFAVMDNTYGQGVTQYTVEVKCKPGSQCNGTYPKTIDYMLSYP